MFTTFVDIIFCILCYHHIPNVTMMSLWIIIIKCEIYLWNKIQRCKICIELRETIFCWHNLDWDQLSQQYHNPHQQEWQVFSLHQWSICFQTSSKYISKYFAESCNSPVNMETLVCWFNKCSIMNDWWHLIMVNTNTF